MNFPIKIKSVESVDHFILPTMEHETRSKYSENRTIKPEPTDQNSDNSEYEIYCKKRTRTTPEQSEKMLAFMRSNTKSLTSSCRDDVSGAWNNLAAELNAIGPPHRTTSEWRRAWSVFKYQKNQQKQKQKAAVQEVGGMKRMRLENTIEHHEILSPRQLPSWVNDTDGTNSSNSKTLPHTTAEDDNVPDTDNFQALILKKMDSVVEHQIRHGNQLERLNQNLEKLIEILTDKFT